MRDTLFDDLETLGTLLKRTSQPIIGEQLRSAVGAVHDALAHDPLAHDPLAPVESEVLPFRTKTKPSRRPFSIAIATAAAATIAGVLWISTDRPNAPAPADQPANSVPSVLQPSATRERIDHYPILDPQDIPVDMPDGAVGGTWSNTTEDHGWSGILGHRPDNGGLPTPLVTVAAHPIGWTFEPNEHMSIVAGRRPDVQEVIWSDMDGTTLLWSVGERPFTIWGDDLDLMYAVIDHVEPIEADAIRGGYKIVGQLPGGLTELDPPRHSPAAWSPGLSDNNDSGTLNLSVDTSSPLNLLLAGDDDFAVVDVGPYSGFIGTREGHVDLAFAITTDETVWISSTVMNREELVTAASRIRFTDETTWRTHYAVEWGGSNPPVSTNTTAIPITTTTNP